MSGDRKLDALVAEQVMGLDIDIAPEHTWRRDDDGEIDMMGMDADTHNGPACDRCGYGFCIHCEGEAGYTAHPCQLHIPHYSTDIAAAWKVVERMTSLGWRMNLKVLYPSNRYGVQFDSERDSALEFAEHAPLTICLAALKAVGVEA